MLNDKFQRMALKNEGNPRRAALLSTYMMLATCLRPVNFKEWEHFKNKIIKILIAQHFLSIVSYLFII